MWIDRWLYLSSSLQGIILFWKRIDLKNFLFVFLQKQKTRQPRHPWPLNLTVWWSMIRGDHPRSHVTLWSLDHVSSRSNGKHVSFSTKPIANKNNRVMDYDNTDFTIWKRERRPWRRCMKICILRMRKIKENPLGKFCCTGDGREKVSWDVLMKTCNIFSKIMLILDMNGIKVLTIFTVEYHTTFFEFILKDWACIQCFAWFFGLFTFFAPKLYRVRLKN